VHAGVHVNEPASIEATYRLVDRRGADAAPWPTCRRCPALADARLNGVLGMAGLFGMIEDAPAASGRAPVIVDHRHWVSAAVEGWCRYLVEPAAALRRGRPLARGDRPCRRGDGAGRRRRGGRPLRRSWRPAAGSVLGPETTLGEPSCAA
jgi:hypothetical protein